MSCLCFFHDEFKREKMMGRPWINNCAVAFIATVAIAANGCNTNSVDLPNVKINSNDDGGNVDIKVGGVEFEASSGSQLKVPDDFPEDVYLPKSEKLISNSKIGPTHMLIFESNKDHTTLFAEAQAKMKEGKWEEVAAVEQATSGMLSYKIEKERTCMIAIAKNKKKDNTSITITYVKLK